MNLVMSGIPGYPTPLVPDLSGNSNGTRVSFPSGHKVVQYTRCSDLGILIDVKFGSTILRFIRSLQKTTNYTTKVLQFLHRLVKNHE